MSNRITSDQIVAEVLANWPEIVPLFVRRKMYCVGCTMSRFETLADISQIYRFDLKQFLAELNQQVENKK